MPRRGLDPNRDSFGPFHQTTPGLQQFKFPSEGPLLSRYAFDDDPRVLAGRLAADLDNRLGQGSRQLRRKCCVVKPILKNLYGD